MARSHATYATAGWAFLRLLGVVYLFAFWSLAQQVTGLIGHDGILPASEYLENVRTWADDTGVGLDRYRLVPTVFWIGTGDRVLQGVAVGGAALSVLQIAGVAPFVVLPLLWIGYLSLTVAGVDFLSFQWDGLLLETGLLALGVAPFAWFDRLRDAADPPWIGRWLLWWLLFRLMFGSGVVKLASGDPSWRDLTAMAFHYETQPLPTPIAWYAAQLPLWFQRVSTGLVLVIELVMPWLIIAGGRVRHVGAAVLLALQAGIAITGNYTFFNLLTAALCVLLIEDRRVDRSGAEGRRVQGARPASVQRRPAWVAITLAVVTVPVSATILAEQLNFPTPSSIEPLRAAIDPLRSTNRYGLFAVMTTTRPEIVLEGSLEGETWRPYAFRYKPGSLTVAPRWVAPFQPRLDWQMWFAALGRYEEERWFQRFCEQLLRGSPSVSALLAENPFPDMPPRFVRATLYRYRFTNRQESQQAGAWWVRERVREYSPALSLDQTRGPN